MSHDDNDLATALAALDAVIEHGHGPIEPHHLAEAAVLRARIDERLGHGDALTVVALAGGTGVGKSALANRLAGDEVVTEGVRRPTTDHPVAVAREFDGPTRALLDHLDIPDRRIGRGLPPGMVLVDLPDHDSVVESHRATSARLTGRVDALVIVVDPIKYARADLHHGPLAELSRHAEVVTAVLNRSDELSEADLAACMMDLSARLTAAGLGDARVVTTSAATGAGTEDLRHRLGELAAQRRAVVQRLLADAAQLGDRMAVTTGDVPDLAEGVGALVGPLLQATDAGRAAAAAASSYRRTARVGCRSPLARAIRLPGRLAAEVRDAFTAPEPATHAPSRSTAAIEAALASHLALEETTGPAHAALAEAIDRIAEDAGPQVVDAVDGVPRRPTRHAWWVAVAGLRGFAEAAAISGLLWLVLAASVRWLGLPELPTPMVTVELSWPAALFLYGLLARVLLGLATRAAIAVGARRHAEHVGEQVQRRLTSMLEDRVAGPMRAELQRHRTVRDQLDALCRHAG